MYHKIDCYAIHTSTTRKKQGFKKKFIRCVTRPDQWSFFNILSHISRRPHSALTVFFNSEQTMWHRRLV